MKLPHRSWFVALGSSLALFTVMGLGANVFSAYQPWIIAVNGFTNAQGSLITTVRSLFAILSMLVVGRLINSIGLRATTGVGMVCSVLSCLVFGLATTFPIYCLGGALAGIAYALAGMIPLSIAIARWFHIRRGYALGLAAAGSGVATVVAPPLIAYSLQASGLSLTFFREGAVMVVLTLVVVALLRNSPEEVGLVPYGAQEDDCQIASDEKTTSVSAPVWLWVLFVAFLTGAPAATAYSHLTVLYTTQGFSDSIITILLSYSGFMIVFGKIIYGQLQDKLGTFYSNYILFGIAALGMALCCLAPTGSIPVAFGAMTAVSIGLSLSVSLSLWAFDLSSTAQRDGRVRWATIAFMVGNLTFGPLPGIIADVTGSYVPAFVLFGGAAAAGLILIQVIYLRYGASMSMTK